MLFIRVTPPYVIFKIMIRSVKATSNYLSKHYKGKSFIGRQGENFNKFNIRVEKGLSSIFKDRKLKKRNNRKVSISNINSSLSGLNINYSRFIYYICRNNICLNRQMLSAMALSEKKSVASLLYLINYK